MRCVAVLALVICVAAGCATRREVGPWDKLPVHDDLRHCIIAFASPLPAQRTVARWMQPDGEPVWTGKDLRDAVAPCAKAAEQGEALAQACLGKMHYHGQGLPLDCAQAFKWFSKAATQGYAEAQIYLARLYHIDHQQLRDGENICKRQDFAKALYWYNQAAEQGDHSAASRLGRMYQVGEGVPKSSKMAYFWWNLSVILNEPEDGKVASEQRDRIAREMTRQELLEAERMSSDWLKRFQTSKDD